MSNFKKFDDGKLRYDLIPTESMKLLAQILTFGADKYGADNWRECKDTSRYVAAAMRHFEAFRGGEIYDQESGLPHLSHCMTNLVFLIELQEAS